MKVKGLCQIRLAPRRCRANLPLVLKYLDWPVSCYGGFRANVLRLSVALLVELIPALITSTRSATDSPSMKCFHSLFLPHFQSSFAKFLCRVRCCCQFCEHIFCLLEFKTANSNIDGHFSQQKTLSCSIMLTCTWWLDWVFLFDQVLICHSILERTVFLRVFQNVENPTPKKQACMHFLQCL